MARTKQKRLSKLSELKNVFSIKNPDVKNEFHNYFLNKKLFTIEIGCGHGDYSVELAQKFPERNFVGIDVKGARIFKGAVKAAELKINNVAFVITKAEWLGEILDPKTVEEIFIPFPEPHIKRSVQDRRLISPLLLNTYKKLLINAGLLHFKTDNSELYDYALKSVFELGGKILCKTEDLHNDKNIQFNSGIITSFENYYIKAGRKIKYICFQF